MLVQNGIRDLREHIDKCKEEINTQETSISQESSIYGKSMKASVHSLVQLNSQEIPEDTDLELLEAHIASSVLDEEAGETFGMEEYKELQILHASLKLRELKQDTSHEKLLEILRLRNLKTVRMIEERFGEELNQLKVGACGLFDVVAKYPEEVKAIKRAILENKGWTEYTSFVSGTFNPHTKSQIEHCAKYVTNWEDCLSASRKGETRQKRRSRRIHSSRARI
jgi:hypothetical protein